MFSFRVAAVVAVSALFVAVGGGAVLAAPPETFGSGPTGGGTTVTGTVTGITLTEVSAGTNFSLALGSDSNAYSWGSNAAGQLGNDSVVTSSNVPVPVLAPAGVMFTQISAGYDHSLAIGSDGKTYAWGDNTSGGLGIGTSGPASPLPTEVELPSGVTFTQVSAGQDFSLAVGSDGNAYAWGENSYGQLGVDTVVDSSLPVLVSPAGGLAVVDVSAGGNHSLAVGADGFAYAWGSNGAGQLGDGTGTGSRVPVQVTGASGLLTQVSAGGNHSLAVGSDGKTYAWGDNAFGQLGNGTVANSLVPTAVSLPTGVTFTEVSSGQHHSLAVGSDGNAYVWGYDSETTPEKVISPADVVFSQLSGGIAHSLAVGSDGNTYGWGYNLNGELGDGSGTSSTELVAVDRSMSVTGVTFDGVAGTGLTESTGSWTIVAPAHEAGVVDVVVFYTQFGDSHSRTTVDGFTYADMLPATGSSTPFIAAGSALLLIVAGGVLLGRRVRA